MITSALALAALLIAFTAGAAESEDPNWGAVQVVCGRCHTTAVFQNQPRSWSRWNDVFADMTTRGATGTDDQLAQVTSYFLENLTLQMERGALDYFAKLDAMGGMVKAIERGYPQREIAEASITCSRRSSTCW